MAFLSCPIHLDRINANDLPIALPCGHIFCTPCLNRLYGDSRLKPCPLCGKNTKKASFLRLYVCETSPGGTPDGTPVKRDGGTVTASGSRSSEIAMEGRRIRDALRGLCDAAGSSRVDRTTFNTAVDATQRMVTFSEKAATSTEDIEMKCLAHEIKDASSRFQSLLFPQLESLLNLQQIVETLKSQNADLEAKLTRKKAELDTISRKRVQQDKEKANLTMAKKLIDERAVGLEKTLDAVHEKLKAAEQDLVIQKGLVTARNEELAKFKSWLAEHKHKAEKYKAEAKRLQDVISIMGKEKAPSDPILKPRLQGQRPRLQLRQPTNENDIMNTIIDLDEDDTFDHDEHLRKRQKTDNYNFGSDSSVDFQNLTTAPKMIGPWRPPPIAKFVTNQETKTSSTSSSPAYPMPLNLDSKGQTKKPLALGPRMRMGKNS